MKSKTTAAILALFLGGWGIHKFYLGKTGLGILYLLFCWTFIPAIIAFIEAIYYFCMNEDEFQRKFCDSGPTPINVSQQKRIVNQNNGNISQYNMSINQSNRNNQKNSNNNQSIYSKKKLLK